MHVLRLWVDCVFCDGVVRPLVVGLCFYPLTRVYMSKKMEDEYPRNDFRF